MMSTQENLQTTELEYKSSKDSMSKLLRERETEQKLALENLNSLEKVKQVKKYIINILARFEDFSVILHNF